MPDEGLAGFAVDEDDAREQVLKLVGTVLAKVPNAPPELILGFQVVSTMLPFLEMTANQLVSMPPRVGAVPVKFRSKLTVDQARVYLRTRR